MATKLGINCKLYVGTTAIAAATESGVETALDSGDLLGPVRTVTINLEKDRTDITTRSNSGWRQYAPGLKDGTIEFEMNSVDSETIVGSIITAYLNDTELAVAALDGAIGTAGSKGLAGNYVVTNLTRNEPIDAAVSYSVQLSPSSMTNWYVAS